MLLGPLSLIWGPAFYMFLSVLALNQFKIAYHFLARIITAKASNPMWQAVQPAFRQQLTFMESVFGSAANFTPTTTHVLLVAIILVLLVNLDSRRH